MNSAKAEVIFKDRCPLWPGLLPLIATYKDKREVAMPQGCSEYLTYWHINGVF